MSLTKHERRDQAHIWQHHRAEVGWAMAHIHLLMFQNTMDYAQADFTNVSCPGGCCRPISACIDGWILALEPKVLNVTGVLNNEENNFWFTKVHGGVLQEFTPDVLKDKYGLHFLQHGEATKWAAYEVKDEVKYKEDEVKCKEDE
jgi:hypothetical protein